MLNVPLCNLMFELSSRNSTPLPYTHSLILSIDGDSFPELEWTLTSGQSTLIFAKTYPLSSHIHAYLYSKAPPGNYDKCICLYHSLNWDSYNSEACKLLAGTPGSANYCQIGIGMDTLSVGVDMPAIDDGLLIGDIEDSDGAFQKWGNLRWLAGVIYWNSKHKIMNIPFILQL
jgi:hypothetical protein